MVYSAASASDFLFQPKQDELQEQHSQIQVIHTCSQGIANGEDGDLNGNFRAGRIDGDLLREVIASTPATSDVLVYICGPPAMIEAMMVLCGEVGITPGQIRIEKWW
jgi:NAD(P)H-flavin reductase